MDLLPTKVLVFVDAASASEHALDTAAALCAAIGAELHLVHVKVLWSSVRSTRSRIMTPTQRAAAEAEGEAVLGRMRKRVEDGGGTVAETHLRFDERIERGLLRAQEELRADLLVIPGQPPAPLSQRMRRGIAPVASASLVKRARCTVLVIQEPAGPEGVAHAGD